MAPLDVAIISAYFLAVLGLGIFCNRRASRDMESYFLGGKGMPWWALSVSGSVSTFDVTGTMWICSILFILGMQSMWHHWMWGVMMGAFFMAYMGKWVRRSNSLTAAEWMKTRFGAGAPGITARTAYAVMAIITTAAFIGYGFQGVGKFASVYVPMDPKLLSLIIIGTTTFYVLLGGFYSVVITQLIQTVILTAASIVIAIIAYTHVTPDLLQASLPERWTSLVPQWRTGIEGYELFGALVIAWVLKGLFLNAGGPAQMYDFQSFLAARNPRDAAKVGASWSAFLVVRWGMCAGITLMAITGLAGVTDPEKVMPMVLHEHLAVGFRGLVIAGLMAAFMGTFDSTVNVGASFIVCDIYQQFFGKKASPRHLVRVGYAATLFLVGLGILIGYQTQSIAGIWRWMMMALGAGVIMPNVLRWYWWRMNGWGYAAGTISGILLSLIALPAISLRLFGTETVPDYITFPVISAASLLASVVVSLATKPVEETILIAFYRTVRPFGLWGGIRAKSALNPEELCARTESAGLAILNTVLGMTAVSGLYLFPMYLVGHWHGIALAWLAIALVAMFALYFTWYKTLPAPEAPEIQETRS